MSGTKSFLTGSLIAVHASNQTPWLSGGLSPLSFTLYISGKRGDSHSQMRDRALLDFVHREVVFLVTIFGKDVVMRPNRVGGSRRPVEER